MSIRADVRQASAEAAKRAADKAAGKTSSKKKPIFLFMKPGYRAVIRPLFPYDDNIGLPVHEKWHEKREYRVQAVCASVNGEPCEHCDTYKVTNDWNMRPKKAVYIPCFVYSVFENGQQVTFEDEQEDGSKVTKLVKGFRLIELFQFGKQLAILDTFDQYEIDTKRAINACDWTYSQIGGGSGKTLTMASKDPAPMQPALAKAIPPIDRFKAMILEHRPPVVHIAADEIASPEEAPAFNADTSDEEAYVF